MRKRMKKLQAILLVVATVTLTMSGCGAKGNSAGSSNDKSAVESSASEINVGISQDLEESLDPHKIEAAGGREVLFNVFEGLYKPDSDGNLIPAVASSYELSDDGLTYTFTLRDGVKFHSGEAVTTEDVKTSLEACADDGSGNARIAAFANIDSIEATDDKTVTVVLKEADPDFMSYIASVKAAIIPASNDKADTDPIGTGPYKYVSRSVQENIILEKFDEYWGNAAAIEKVTFKVCADADTVTTSLNSGAIDMMAHMTTTQAAQLSDEYDTVEDTMNLVQALYLNHASAPFDNELVCQALCYAVDKAEINAMVSDGKGVELGSSMFPNFEKYYMPELSETYRTDIDKAKELLKEAGYENGFTFTITVPGNYPQHVDTAQVIVEQLKKIGVTAQINQVEWDTWLSDVYSNREYEATVVGVDASNLSASAMLSRFCSDASNNFVNYSNADYDKAYQNAREAKDDSEATEYYKECETILAETGANVYIQDLPEMVALNKKFTGYECYPLYVQDISKIRPQ